MNTVTALFPAVCRSAAGIAAVNCVAVTNVVVSAAPFQCATELLLKLVPVNVRLKAAAPRAADVCERDVRVGDGLLIGSVTALENPPPGVGLNTAAVPEPAVAIWAAVTVAVNCVELTNVVGRATELSQPARELLTKPLPFIVSVNVGPPAITEAGDRDVTTGRGLVIENEIASGVPTLGDGLVTVTITGTGVAMSEAGTKAVSDVALTNVVVSGEPFQVTVAP